MEKEYSYKKGLVKGIVSGLTVLLALVAFAGLSDITLWSLAEEYVKPFLVSITVGGAITFIINYVKIKYLN